MVTTNYLPGELLLCCGWSSVNDNASHNPLLLKAKIRPTRPPYYETTSGLDFSLLWDWSVLCTEEWDEVKLTEKDGTGCSEADRSCLRDISTHTTGQVVAVLPCMTNTFVSPRGKKLCNDIQQNSKKPQPNTENHKHDNDNIASAEKVHNAVLSTISVTGCQSTFETRRLVPITLKKINKEVAV